MMLGDSQQPALQDLGGPFRPWLSVSVLTPVSLNLTLQSHSLVH